MRNTFVSWVIETVKIKHFLDRKPIGTGRGNSKYKTYEKNKSKEPLENSRM